jgi:hypothetical protein
VCDRSRIRGLSWAPSTWQVSSTREGVSRAFGAEICAALRMSRQVKFPWRSCFRFRATVDSLAVAVVFGAAEWRFDDTQRREKQAGAKSRLLELGEESRSLLKGSHVSV